MDRFTKDEDWLEIRVGGADIRSPTDRRCTRLG